MPINCCTVTVVQNICYRLKEIKSCLCSTEVQASKFWWSLVDLDSPSSFFKFAVKVILTAFLALINLNLCRSGEPQWWLVFLIVLTLSNCFEQAAFSNLQFKFVIFRFATHARLSLLTAFFFFSNNCNKKVAAVKKTCWLRSNSLSITRLRPVSLFEVIVFHSTCHLCHQTKGITL